MCARSTTRAWRRASFHWLVTEGCCHQLHLLGIHVQHTDQLHPTKVGEVPCGVAEMPLGIATTALC